MFKQTLTVFLLNLTYFYVVSSQKINRVDGIPLSHDDEDPEILGKFLEQLEIQSGLNSLEPSRSISGVKCGNSSVPTITCTINPNGSVLWDVRYQLYESHMMQSKDDELSKEETIDGCQIYYQDDPDGYKKCMQNVRKEMLVDIVISFQTNFKKIIEKNCSLVAENCVGAVN